MALLNVTNIPSEREPFIDERTGLVSRTWYRFLLRLFDITGAGGNTITIEDLQKAPSDTLISQFFELDKKVDGLLAGPLASSITEQTYYTIAPFDIVLTASPFTYQNTASYTLDVLMGGNIGGVVKLEFSRDGVTWYETGSFYGMFTLSPYDSIKITYVAAPTVTGIPR